MSYMIRGMKPRRKPTDAEIGILRVLWTRGPSTVREVAEVLGVSPVTVKRNWRIAKAFLLKQLDGTLPD